MAVGSKKSLEITAVDGIGKCRSESRVVLRTGNLFQKVKYD
jgi:hypothetical protein